MSSADLVEKIKRQVQEIESLTVAFGMFGDDGEETFIDEALSEVFHS